MPAKKLSAEQLAEANRLKAWFREFQSERKRKGETWTQEELAAELGFGQSALNQYLGGTIPLNPLAVRRFSSLLNKPPGEISPIAMEMARAQARAAADFLALADLPPNGARPPTPPKPSRNEKLLNPGEKRSTKRRGHK